MFRMATREDHGGPRIYGRRKGHKLSARKQALIDELLPKLRIDPGRRLASACELFPHPVEAVGLEIGFGAGEHLCEQARAHPGWGFIGAEVYLNGVAALLSRIERQKIQNIRLHDGDARELIAWIPEASLNRIFVLFPDPWPKKRHQKRRLVSPHAAAAFARLLKTGGELRIASDIPEYIRFALFAVRSVAAFEWSAESPRDWRARPPDWPQTRYEAKALRDGRHCTYLRFVRR